MTEEKTARLTDRTFLKAAVPSVMVIVASLLLALFAMLGTPKGGPLSTREFLLVAGVGVDFSFLGTASLLSLAGQHTSSTRLKFSSLCLFVIFLSLTSILELSNLTTWTGSLAGWARSSIIHRCAGFLIVVAFAGLLYWLRQRRRLHYGVLEIFVGLNAIWITLGSDLKPEGCFAALLGATYVIIRGLENARVSFAETAKPPQQRPAMG